ncbi:MAG: glycosyltransferase [Deltaproteobacteria bacterium]|nr:glycosyltransferase [Deltaproteobacteria bacterium]
MLVPELQEPRAHRPRRVLTAAPPWPRRIAVLSDYVRLPYANGATFATQFLYRELVKRGHEVTIIGPHDPAARPEDLPERYILLPSVPLRQHPGVYLPLPTDRLFERARHWDFDLVLGQTNTELIELGLWLRHNRGVPLLCVNTVHLPRVYPAVLPEALDKSPAVHWLFQNSILELAERQAASVYDQSDGLIVLSQGLERYWRSRGVTAPIHVIPRNVEPRIFDANPGPDPFPRSAKPGSRILVVCRHTKEKGVERLLRLFARWVAPAHPDATLTLVGDGPDHDFFKQVAREEGIEDRTVFPGEYPVTGMPTWYRHADLFAYTSLSETYGQVVSEALWSRLPVVAFEDGMGVSQQVEHDLTGLLVDPGPDAEMADWRFARALVSLLKNPRKRLSLAQHAERRARERSAPERMVERFLGAFEAAGRHQQALGSPSRAGGALDNAARKGRWFGFTGLVAGLGYLRPPATLNRHGRRQPAWNDLLEE